MSTSKTEIQKSYGVNNKITGEYEAELSAKCLNGTFVGKRRNNIISFRGVPFAKQPVGSLRWKRPVPPDNCDEVFEAYYNGKSPVQTEWESEKASYYPQGEDCLYLNIWLNETCPDADKTVMVFFHGGSYGWGGTADPLYNGHNFVSAHPDIILVTVGYRVGLLGFVDLSYIPGGEDYPDAPNLGLLDQIEALRWIKKNIQAFGGNPDNVTIFGESAGGGSVSLLPIIPEAKGLFRRVIAQSGSVALTSSKAECREYTRKLIEGTGVRHINDLMKLSTSEIIALNKKLNLDNNFPQRDGKLIPLDPYAPYEEGYTVDVDMLIGTNANELNYWVGELGGIVPYRFSMPVKYENDIRLLTKIDRRRVHHFMSGLKGHSIWKITEFYNEIMFRLPAIKQAEYHSRNGGKVFMYYWTEPSSIPFRGACHAVELAYVFGNTNEAIYTGKPANKNLSAAVMSMWANFAKTGNPSLPKLKWDEYDCSNRKTMILSMKLRMADDVHSVHRKHLSPILRHMLNASSSGLDFNVPFVRKAVVHVLAVSAATAATVIAVRKLLKD